MEKHFEHFEMKRFGPVTIANGLVESAKREWQILLVLLLAAIAFWAFAEIAEEVLEGDTKAIDEMVLLWFRDASDPTRMFGPGWFQEMMRDFTALGGFGILFFASAGAIGFLLLEGKWHAAILLLVAILGAVLISTLMKLGFDRPRPDLVPHGSIVTSASFPSGHSTLSAAVYLTIGALIARFRPDRSVKIYVLGMASVTTFLVGVSRVYLGVHWPTDVLAGWAVGAGWAFLCWFVALLLQSRGSVERS